MENTMNFSPFMFFVNMMAYALMMGLAPQLAFAVMNASDNRPPMLVPSNNWPLWL